MALPRDLQKLLHSVLLKSIMCNDITEGSGL